MSGLSASALALREALRDEALASKIRARVHRVSLSRYCNGHRRPQLETALFFEAVSDGRISIAGWTTAGSLLSRERSHS